MSVVVGTGSGPDRPPMARFRAYAADLRHASELMVARLNTLLSSQSFLAIAYSTSMGSANGRWREPFTLVVPPVLALLGFLLALAGHLDIKAARSEVAHWQRLATELLAQHPELRTHVVEGRGGVRCDTPRSAGEVVASRAPLVFMAGWTWFFIAPWLLRAM